MYGLYFGGGLGGDDELLVVFPLSFVEHEQGEIFNDY